MCIISYSVGPWQKNSSSTVKKSKKRYSGAAIIPSMSSSAERLSSGYRINRAADDPAGLAISEKMRAQIRGLQMASKNAQDAISMVQTAEGAFNEVHSMLQRMRELSVQAASDTNENQIDRDALNAEYQMLVDEINDTSRQMNFNRRNLFDGSMSSEELINITSTNVGAGVSAIRVNPSANLSEGNWSFTNALFTPGGTLSFQLKNGTTNEVIRIDGGPLSVDAIEAGRDRNGNYEVKMENGVTVVLAALGGVTNDATFAAALGTGMATERTKGTDMIIQTGANQGDTMTIRFNRIDAAVLGLEGSHLLDRESASKAIGLCDKAVTKVASERARLGAVQNRLQHKISNLDTMAENLQDAESRIRDVDIAKEMMNYVKHQIQMQASMAMIAQANQNAGMVLQLLQ